MSDENSDTVTISDTSSLATTNDLNEMSKRFKCNICNRGFVSRYNLQRHSETFHADDSESSSSDMEEDSESSSSDIEDSESSSSVMEEDSESSSSDMEEDSETQDTSESMSEESSEEESSGDEDSDDKDENFITRIIRDLAKEAYLTNKEETDEMVDKHLEENKPEGTAVREAFQCCDRAKKTFRRLFAQSIADINEQRHHPLYKSIMEKVRKLISKGFSKQEAISSAVDYRKHGIDNLTKFL